MPRRVWVADDGTYHETKKDLERAEKKVALEKFMRELGVSDAAAAMNVLRADPQRAISLIRSLIPPKPRAPRNSKAEGAGKPKKNGGSVAATP